MTVPEIERAITRAAASARRMRECPAFYARAHARIDRLLTEWQRARADQAAASTVPDAAARSER